MFVKFTSYEIDKTSTPQQPHTLEDRRSAGTDVTANRAVLSKQPIYASGSSR